MARNCNARLLDNNFNDSDATTISYSSQLSGTFASSNTLNAKRSKVWKPNGNFRVKASAQLIYINDGADKTATLTIGEYPTPTQMATQIQTQLNAVSSSWTCVWSATTLKFAIARTAGAAVLRFATTANAAWDLLGYTATANDSTGPFPAEEIRIHSREFYQLDLGLAYACPAFCAIGPIDEVFSLSATATVTVKADNVDAPANWDTPAFQRTVTPTEAGIFAFFDDADATPINYRYWRFEFSDRLNSAGPSAFKFSHLYFGDYFTMTMSNIATGFTWARIDQTDADESQSGEMYFNRRTKYRQFQSMSIELMDADERRDLTRLFQKLGTDGAFYLALDPTNAVSETSDELTAFGRFASEPSLNNVIRDLYTVSLDFREAV